MYLLFRYCNNGLENKCIVSFSSDFSNELVLKVNKENGSIRLYRNVKMFLFAKEKEQFSYELEGKIKKQWFTNDICGLTYKDKDGNLREYVATYGDRGNGMSYYNVTSAILGHWQVFTQYGSSTQLLADSKGITITKNGKKELFEYSDCKQFGTIALVLYKNDIPKYVVALDENCKIDEETDIIKKDGTITLSEISMEKTISESLYCMTYKNENDMSDYNVVSVRENDYKIQKGIMYISFDGTNTIEVPGDFSEMQESYNKYNYQISKEKTIFYYVKNDKRYLVYSNDMGENWNDIFWGIGDDEKFFKAASQIKFINENIGFLTMPMVGGESSEIYITKDGGNNFTRLQLLESDIYDYYNLPTFENEKLYIKISQGSDGDYNGGDYKTYYSEDNGNQWNIVM